MNTKISDRENAYKLSTLRMIEVALLCLVALCFPIWVSMCINGNGNIKGIDGFDRTVDPYRVNVFILLDKCICLFFGRYRWIWHVVSLAKRRVHATLKSFPRARIDDIDYWKDYGSYLEGSRLNSRICLVKTRDLDDDTKLGVSSRPNTLFTVGDENLPWARRRRFAPVLRPATCRNYPWASIMMEY
ncbi:hypothetical protein L2E82_49210 [Cichorium intybus]|uniref:Uncharacterized protein n=1 Tax=Cichorium intybus TaxID=13427 RepID=A0ACB8YZ21_CICIN|nr:hypothetical protein L2E82_49210 [Cichorium intybus]